MDPMDYQMDTEDHTVHYQNNEYPRCPYRASSVTSPFYHPNSFNHASRPYLSPPQPPSFWDHVVRQNLPPYHTLHSGAGPGYPSHIPGRAPELTSFDDYIAGEGLDPRAPPYHAQSRISAQDENRSSGQTQVSSTSNEMEQSAGARRSENPRTPTVGPIFPSRLPDISNHDEWNGRRTENTAFPRTNSAHGPTANTQRLQLPIPPPQSSQQSYNASANYTPFHQQVAFPIPSDRYTSSGNPMSSSSPPRADTLFPNTPVAYENLRLGRSEYELADSHVHLFESESDGEDYTEEQEELLRHEAQLDPGSTRVQQLMSRMAAANRRHGVHSGEARELQSERNRAARRAALAAVKMVASAGAVASFEQIDKNSLKVEDQICIICYNEFGVKNPDGFTECPVRLPKCKHLFGDHCLKQWLKDSDSCPYCRDKLESEPKRLPPPSDARARISLNQHYAELGMGGSQDPAMLLNRIEHERRHTQLIQGRLLRDGSVQDSHMRYRAHDGWGASLAPPGGSPSPSVTRMPQIPQEYGDSRRRLRGQGNSRRGTTQSNRSSRTSSSRASRNSTQGGTMRTPVTSSRTSVDEGSSPNHGSTTLQPDDTSSWSSPATVGSTTTFRPSSLPERSPLGEASETNSGFMGHRSLSGNGSGLTLPNPLTDAARYDGWGSPAIANSRSGSGTLPAEAILQGMLRGEQAGLPAWRNGGDTTHWSSSPSR